MFKKLKQVVHAGIKGTVEYTSSFFGGKKNGQAVVESIGPLAFVGGIIGFVYTGTIATSFLHGLACVAIGAVGLPLGLFAGAALVVGTIGFVSGAFQEMAKDSAPDSAPGADLAQQLESLSPEASAKLLNTLQKKAGSAFNAANVDTPSTSVVSVKAPGNTL